MGLLALSLTKLRLRCQPRWQSSPGQLGEDLLARSSRWLLAVPPVVWLSSSVSHCLEPSHRTAPSRSAAVIGGSRRRTGVSERWMASDTESQCFGDLISHHVCSLFCLGAMWNIVPILESTHPAQAAAVTESCSRSCHIELSQSYSTDFLCICIALFFDFSVFP